MVKHQAAGAALRSRKLSWINKEQLVERGLKKKHLHHSKTPDDVWPVGLFYYFLRILKNLCTFWSKLPRKNNPKGGRFPSVIEGRGFSLKAHRLLHVQPLLSVFAEEEKLWSKSWQAGWANKRVRTSRCSLNRTTSLYVISLIKINSQELWVGM